MFIITSAAIVFGLVHVSSTHKTETTAPAAATPMTVTTEVAPPTVPSPVVVPAQEQPNPAVTPPPPTNRPKTVIPRGDDEPESFDD
jgi:hypothetical protein